VASSCAWTASGALLGELPLVRQRVDGDDVLRAGEGGALHGVDADAADPVDHHRLTRPHVARVDRGAPAGGHPAADQRGRLQRQVVVDLDAGVLRHRGVLGERAEQAHLAEVEAVGVEAERAIGQAVVIQERAEVAHVGHTAGAEPAVAADGQERADDVVARLQPGHAGPDLLDDARALVAADDRVADGNVAGLQVLVGVAQADRHPAHQHLAGLGGVEVHLGDLEVIAQLAENRCLGLHAPSCPCLVILRASGPAVIGGQPQECGGVIVAAPVYPTGTARAGSASPPAASCSSELWWVACTASSGL
jgi:hypothetical protein